jgi:predicted ribosome quality control (RQC) complex YloA/Tae2 family protein
MGKQRMNALDLACVVAELQHLVGTRLQNVYDVTQQMYALKFVKGDLKENLIVEAGIRFHSTKYNREKPRVPSSFTMKLRKHIRNWRLESFTLVERDRIVDLCFGCGEAAQHLLLELYAKGNVILTDHTYKIVSLLRTHKEEDVKFAVHETYPIGTIAQPAPTLEIFTKTLSDPSQQQSTVKLALTACSSCGPSIVEHCLMGANVRCNLKVAQIKDLQEFLGLVAPPLLEAENWMKTPPSGKGVIVRKIGATQSEDFAPILLRQFTSEEWEVEYTPSFNEAVDIYFAALETKKVEIQEEDKTKTVESKKERFLREHRKRVEELENNEAMKEHVATLLQQHVPEIEEVLTIVRGAIQRGMSWEELGRVIKVRQREGHPTANLIHRLALERNCVELLLSDKTEDEDEADPSAPVTVVEIDIDLSAYANARRYYDMKRAHHVKLEKTKAAEGKAAISTEKKSKRIGEKIVIKKEPQQARPVFWFEKFQWFITTDGYMVVAGRDAQQNELLVRRYLRRGDIFVHVDIPEAPCGIVKNPECRPIQLGTLEEAGSMVVCRSSAWESRTVISAWWVHYHQVTRPFADTGSPVPFTIKGKKNYLSPKPLTMGMTLLFRLSDSSPSATKVPRTTPPPQEDLILPTDPTTDDNGPMTRQSTDDDFGIGDVQLSAANDVVPDPAPVSGRARNSAKARRPARREVSDDSSEVTSASQGGKTSSIGTSQDVPSRRVSPPPQQNQQTAQVRKSKLKKIQKKYGDQDDEDREKAMLLLGNPLAKCQTQTKTLSHNQSSTNDLAEAEDDVKQTITPSQQKSGPKKEVRFTDPTELHRANTEPVDDSALVEKIQSEMSQLYLFSGTPTDEDIVLYCIPMCAPLHTVHRFKYVVKLTPGTERKGRSAKVVQHLFTVMSAGNDGHKAVTARCKEDEFISVILGACKVHNQVEPVKVRTSERVIRPEREEETRQMAVVS